MARKAFLTALAGSGLAAGRDHATGCDTARDHPPRRDEIAETILPETDTPGAKAAAVGPFMALMVRDVYSLPDQQQRLQLPEQLDREQKTYMDAREAARRCSRGEVITESPEDARMGDPDLNPKSLPTRPRTFRIMKELALLGYFTSEIGYHQAMRYVETSGRFDPCVPYSSGEEARAPHP